MAAGAEGAQELRAVFFDIDDTLMPTSEFAAQARWNSVHAMIDVGLRISPDKLKAELDEVIAEFSSNHEQHYDKLLTRLPRRLYKGINPALIVAAGVTAYHETKFRELHAYEDALEVLKLLSQTELILGIITSGLPVKQAEKLIRMRIYPYLTPSAIFISHQLGISKPNVKLYQRVCSDLNLKPAQIMYVGNDPVMDIDPPNRLGMVTVRCLRSGRRREAEGETDARYRIENFWDLLDILRDDFGVQVQVTSQP